MTLSDGQMIAVDLDGGRGKRLQVHDVGGGLYTASDPLNGDKVLAVEPQSGNVGWSTAGAGGEFEQFTVDGNIICFCSKGGNPKGNVRLFGFSSNVKSWA